MRKKELINKIESCVDDLKYLDNELKYLNRNIHEINEKINFILNNPPKYKVGNATKIGMISSIKIGSYDSTNSYHYEVMNLNNDKKWFDEKTLDLLLK